MYQAKGQVLLIMAPSNPLCELMGARTDGLLSNVKGMGTAGRTHGNIAEWPWLQYLSAAGARFGLQITPQRSPHQPPLPSLYAVSHLQGGYNTLALPLS